MAHLRLRSTLLLSTLAPFTFPFTAVALSQLRADLYDAPATLPDGSAGFWQPTVVTLVSGASEAVLVDTLFTAEQGVALGDWIEATRHTARFPRGPGPVDARVHRPRGHAADAGVSDVLERAVPGVVPYLRGALEDGKITMEGHTFEAVDVGYSDTDETTILHVPPLRMAVAGDVVYNDVLMWMAESPAPRQRDAWLRSLDRVASIRPEIVVGSHHRPGGLDGAFSIEASKQYIRTFGKLREESKSAEELYDKVLEAYPNHIGKLVLWLGCQAQFAPEEGSSQSSKRDELLDWILVGI